MTVKIYKTLTPSEAREMEKMLADSDLKMELKAMHLDGRDTYVIYQRESHE